MKDRDPLASIALGTNTSSMSAISDYGYEFSFSRELEAIGNEKILSSPTSASKYLRGHKKADSMGIRLAF